jgi:cytochrome c oxidase subunit 2
MTLRKMTRRVTPVLVAGGILLALTGCGGNENALAPESHAEGAISHLFWIVFAGCAIGFGVIVVLLFLGWWRRATPTLPFGGDEKAATGIVIGLGVALPIALLVALFVYSDIFVMKSTAAPARGAAQLTINVTGHQFWWQVDYGGSSAATANEIHIPVHTNVEIVARTSDVIHSFWIPQLNRKMDMIPGQANHLLLNADKPGTYAGHCAEFCGLQHAHMVVLVIAQSRPAFDRWLAHNAQPAASASSRGKQVFLNEACADCHQIRGTDAHGTVGPDLTHFATRRTIAAVRVPNDPKHLREWLRDPQDVKPGNKMPNLAMSDADWRAVQQYMESLR